MRPSQTLSRLSDRLAEHGPAQALVDIESTVDEAQFKSAQLTDDATGLSEVTDEGVRDAVSGRIIEADWAGLRLGSALLSVASRGGALGSPASDNFVGHSP